LPQSFLLAVPCQAEALKAQIASLLENVFANPAAIPLAFTEDYEQTTDGKRLSRAEFEEHVRHVRASVRSIRFTVCDAVRHENHFADRHIAEITYSDGRSASVEVYLFAKLRDGRIAQTHELTRVLSGDDSAKSLASALR
jgi:hypothetical protein